MQERASVIFPDGVLVSAPTWGELEKELMSDSWNPSTRAKFRDEFARRAWAWSKGAVQTERGSKAFFQSLEDAGMLRIVEGSGQ